MFVVHEDEAGLPVEVRLECPQSELAAISRIADQ